MSAIAAQKTKAEILEDLLIRYLTSDVGIRVTRSLSNYRDPLRLSQFGNEVYGLDKVGFVKWRSDIGGEKRLQAVSPLQFATVWLKHYRDQDHIQARAEILDLINQRKPGRGLLHKPLSMGQMMIATSLIILAVAAIALGFYVKSH